MRTAAVLFASALAFTTYSLHASSGDLPPGWSLQGEAPQLYSGGIDREDSPSGEGSVVLRRTEASHAYGAAMLLQTFSAADYAGKKYASTITTACKAHSPANVAWRRTPAPAPAWRGAVTSRATGPRAAASIRCRAIRRS